VSNWIEVERNAWGKWNKAFRNPRNLATCPLCGALDIGASYLVWDPKPLVVAKREYVGRGFEWQWCCGCFRYRMLACAVPAEWSLVNAQYGEPPAQVRALSECLLSGGRA
jgi:hypothetical protein